jgi:hypothetical protein
MQKCVHIETVSAALPAAAPAVRPVAVSTPLSTQTPQGQMVGSREEGIRLLAKGNSAEIGTVSDYLL